MSIDAVSAALQEGRFAEARRLAEDMIAHAPGDAQAWHLKATACAQMGDTAGAVAGYTQAIRCKPDFAQACFDLACMFDRMGQPDFAVKAYGHWLKIEQLRPDEALKPLGAGDAQALEAWFRKGEAYQRLCDHENAILAYRQALAIQPFLPEALGNLGNALYYLNRYEEAEKTLLECLRAKPGHTAALNTLAMIYKARGQFSCAIAALRHALDLKPDYLPAASNLALLYYSLQRYGDAIDAYRTTLALDPHHTDALCHLVFLLHRFCDWRQAAPFKAKMLEALSAGTHAMAPLIVSALFASPSLQLGNARRFTAAFHPAAKTTFAPAAARSSGPLRIGYLSADFHDHATSRLISELFELHDRSLFDIHAYSYGAQPVSPRIALAARPCALHHMDDRQAAARIAGDGIDILVDLKGYTKDQRMGILAARPSPVQVHYLGFPASTGAEYIDYFITDPIASPQGADAGFCEKLVRLPFSYQINDRKRGVPIRPQPRAAYGLPETGFVFCGFNNSYKITPELFAVWMRLLNAIEGSVLWLYASYGQAMRNLRSEAAQVGVDPARIVFAPPLPPAQHLERYLQADLAVDTFPVGGHTTTSDALWCGVPVVALSGGSFISRVAASLLHAVGLGELAATDIASYEAIALALARDTRKLAALKEHLRARRMGFALFDSLATTRALEAAYRRMIALHRAHLPPQPFGVMPDGSVV